MSFKVNNQKIEVTMFNDKTSQVWKLPEHLFLLQTINIEWYFDHEGEVMQLVQLVDLFRSQGPRIVNLYIDYLPYARQDKEISNSTTFALRSFAKVLNTLELDSVKVLDAHSKILSTLNKNVSIITPYVLIENLIDYIKCEVICYPDAGSKIRYFGIFYTPSITLTKSRNQLTGSIEKLKLPLDEMINVDVLNKRILIVDDLCDGGRTFIEAAKELYYTGAKEVNLYVTHGLFSNGLKPLVEAKINRIFTKNGEAELYGNNIVYKTWDFLNITGKNNNENICTN